MGKGKGKGEGQVGERLRAAAEELDLVRLERGEIEPLEGYVVGVGEQWCLVARLDPALVLDGHVAVRLQDLSRLRTPPRQEVAQGALVLREQWPPRAPEGVQLDDVRSVVTSLAAPLVTVHPEHDDPDVCFVGQPRGFGRRTLWLRELTPAATWTNDVTKHRLDAITRIDVGGRYEQALLELAGPPPAD